MHTITSNINLATDPGIIVILALICILVFVIASKIIKKYKYTYTIFERNNNVDTDKVRYFHEMLGRYLLDTKEIHKKLTEDKSMVLFSQLIELQEKLFSYTKKSLEYEYLPVSTTVDLELILKNLTINFHNMPYSNLNEAYIEKEKLLEEYKEISFSINSKSVFLDLNLTIEEYLVHFRDFIAFCKKNTKNAILEKLESFKSLSEFELKSFEESFSHIANKKLDTDNILFLTYNLLIEIFNEQNSEILQDIKKFKQLQHKLEDQRTKYLKIEDKINKFIEITDDLENELDLLRNLTSKTNKYSFLPSKISKLRM